MARKKVKEMVDQMKNDEEVAMAILRLSQELDRLDNLAVQAFVDKVMARVAVLRAKMGQADDNNFEGGFNGAKQE